MARFATIGSNFVTDFFLKAAQGAEGFHLEGVYSRTRTRSRAHRPRNTATRRWWP